VSGNTGCGSPCGDASGGGSTPLVRPRSSIAR
jgi:hypothetical protein